MGRVVSIDPSDIGACIECGTETEYACGDCRAFVCERCGEGDRCTDCDADLRDYDDHDDEIEDDEEGKGNG